MLYDEKDQAGQSFDELVCKLALGRTFSIRAAGKAISNRAFAADELPRTGLSPRSVSYINTDLNDFGRGNDLRKSPKDLSRDFGSEMFSRLRLEQDAHGVFPHFGCLQEMCDKVLRTPLAHYADRRIIPPSFRLKTFRGDCDKVEIMIDRRDGTKPVPINFLSAGENEVFFVLLMILNLSRNPKLGASIILLDEPDLHIATSTRGAFFRSILTLTGGKSQVIMSTHSPAMFELLKARYKTPDQKVAVISRVMLNAKEAEAEGRGTRLGAAYDAVYLGKMRKANVGAGLWGWIRSRLTMFFSYHFARTRSVLNLGDASIWIALVTWSGATFVALLLIAGALLNDTFNDPDSSYYFPQLFLGYDEESYHRATRGMLWTFIGGAVGPVAAVALMRLYFRRLTGRRIEEFRNAHSD